ncbi:resolvase [Tardibacter chloracetimidivorans]|uniref:Resolvase n=1 Tax=Tardibacter chloracetimidivorans TaxID=1921510 RepID=A0A1L3ZZK0_9SPHN|nr:recombinase family protein [Tardibacter chloracetimidivorans]API61058.1 resolvase [Tardibacter chloracetimidivorans]
MKNGFVSYLRVSTERQGASGLGIDAQRSAIRRYVELCGGEIAAELVEVESGKRSDRPVLEEAISLCRRKKATLLVAKLDRLSRTVSFMSRLIETGVDFVAVDNPHANKLMIHVLSAFAEHERDLIGERTRVALAAAKSRGARLGNPDIAAARAQARLSIQSAADDFCANVGPLILQIRGSGIHSLQGIADALAARGIRTARGGAWHPATVRNVERRFRQHGADLRNDM